MKKIIDLYIVTSLIEIIFNTLALGAFIYYRSNEDFAGYSIILFLYLSSITSLLIGIKIVKLTQAKIKTKEDYIIVGYITTVIKFLVTVVLIIAELYFTARVTEGVYNITQKNFIFYLIIFAFLLWNIFSGFNCVAYFFITKMNKNIPLTEVDDIGS